MLCEAQVDVCPGRALRVCSGGQRDVPGLRPYLGSSLTVSTADAGESIRNGKARADTPLFWFIKEEK